MARGKGNGPGRSPKLLDMVEWDERVKGSETGETMKVTDTLANAFVKLLEIGHDPKDVADALDVDVSSYYNWRRLGQDIHMRLAENPDLDLTEAEDAYFDFLHASNRARGAFKRALEARLVELLPTMEAREVTDVLARVDKLKWSKASSMRIDLAHHVNIMDTHGPAVGKLLNLVVNGLLGQDTIEDARRFAPEIVSRALAEVVAPDPDEPKELSAGSH